MAVLDVRGTHGSGKSWVMHQLLERFDHEPIVEGGEHLGYHLEKPDAALLGKYSNVCGGCDGIKSADEVVRRVRLFNERFNYVLLEGILVAHTYKRYAELAREIGDYRFLFLSTPLKTCVARTVKRRKDRGNTKPFNPKHLTNDFRQIWINLRPRMRDEGFTVVELDWKNPMPRVLEELGCA